MGDQLFKNKTQNDNYTVNQYFSLNFQMILIY
jgi:hypothetical protein